MKFSGKLWLAIVLKVTKNVGFTFPLENTFLEKPRWKNWIEQAFINLRLQEYDWFFYF